MGHLEKEPLPLPWLPDDAAGQECRNLIARALAKTPQDRFPSAESFLEDVRRIRAMLPPLSQWPVANPAMARAGDGPGVSAVCAVTPAGIDATSPGQPAWANDPAQTAVPPAPAGDTTQAAPHSAIAAKDPASPAPEEHAATDESIHDQEGTGPRQPHPASLRRRGRRKGLLPGIGLAMVLGLGGYLVLVSVGKTPPAPVATQPAAFGGETSPQSPAAPARAEADALTAQEPAQPSQAAPGPPKGILAGQSQPDAATPPEPAVKAPAPTATAGEAPTPEASATQAAPPATTPEARQVRQGSGPEPQPAPASPAPDAAANQIPAATPAMPQEQKPAKPQALYITVDDARLREQPSDTAEVLTRLNKGTRVTALAQNGDWIQISEPGGRTGFVSAALTATSAPSPPPPAVAARPAAKQAAPRPAVKPDAPPQSGWRIIK
ncbi:DNA polymerase III subunits gamma and tau [Desulfovibrio sp. DV]|nr:DNA polymerase III subunits gamma and tau [Desulfovibrio sp. DV]